MRTIGGVYLAADLVAQLSLLDPELQTGHFLVEDGQVGEFEVVEIVVLHCSCEFDVGVVSFSVVFALSQQNLAESYLASFHFHDGELLHLINQIGCTDPLVLALFLLDMLVDFPSLSSNGSLAETCAFAIGRRAQSLA
jgi:SNF family Na+-dependent transporter